MQRFAKFSLFIAICFIVLFGNWVLADGKAEETNSMNYIIMASVISLAGMGVLFGFGLGIASKIFEVKVDPKITEINNVLPQAQCGMCGFAGCAAFAEAVVKGEAPPNGCGPGGEEVVKAIGQILGVEVEAVVPPVATVCCTRKGDVKKRHKYDGIKDCRAAVTLHDNIYECAFACLGLGTCASVCPFDAIYMDDNDMPVINEEACTGCGVCVSNCPVNVIRMTPRNRHVHVLCVSTEPAKVRAKVHKPGACIGCRKCVKNCPEDAITMVNTVAVIDYEKCTNCEKCISVCPTKAIHNIRPGEKPANNTENSESKQEQSEK